MGRVGTDAQSHLFFPTGSFSAPRTAEIGGVKSNLIAHNQLDSARTQSKCPFTKRQMRSPKVSTERQIPATTLDAELLEIAHRHIDRIETLETRRSDSLDFHDIAVWELKSALEAAYRAGQANVAKKLGART
jgi:hypothetical protein